LLAFVASRRHDIALQVAVEIVSGSTTCSTERLELRVEEDLLQRIDDWMDRTGMASSRSDALRQLVDIGLGAVTGKTVHLSAGDKLNFMLLRDIAKHLKVPTEIDAELMAEVIYGGHYWAPVWEMQGLFHNHADRPADVSLVVNALDMWSFIEERVEKLEPKDLEKVKAANYGHAPTFDGFDGNNEAELMSIASFLVEKMSRFSRFKGRDFNSHSPSAARQRRMIAVFEPIRATLGFGRQLNANQIIDILKAEPA
jgi:uncharacterized protein YfbU (UPF0304 family)